MIILKVMLDGMYGFDHFDVDFSRSDKVDDSIVGTECLEGRENFRYKKVNVLMGQNASGKTVLGEALADIFSFINILNPGSLYPLTRGITKERAMFSIDFVNEGYILHSLLGIIDNTEDEETCSFNYYRADIDENDNYQKCITKRRYIGALNFKHNEDSGEWITSGINLHEQIGKINHTIVLSDSFVTCANAKMDTWLQVCSAILPMIDPSITLVEANVFVKDALIATKNGERITIHNNCCYNTNLSNGLLDAISICSLVSAIMSENNGFYYCGNMFAHIDSDIEQAIFGLMLEKLGDRQQLIFTTHNRDMLELNLPKHSYTFLRRITLSYARGISASGVVAEDENLRTAVENNAFCTMPDLSRLRELD